MTLLSDATMLEEEDQMVPYSSIIEVLSLEQIAKVAEMATTMMADFKPENNGLSCGMATASQCSGIDTTGALSPHGTLSPNPETEKCYINLDKWQSELSNNNGYNDLSMYDDLQTPTSGFTTTQSPNGTLRNFGLPQVRSCTPQSLSTPQCVKNLNSTGNAGLCNGLNVFKNAMETTVTSTNGMYGATVKTEVQDDYDCPVEEIVMDQVRRDMQLACTRLDIPPDPYQWTPNQTKAWVAWNIDQFRLHAVNLAYFDMNGTTLCMLSEDDFKARAPLGGEMLYAQLEIWRNGFKLFEITPPTSPSSPSSGYCQQYNGVRCPSKGSVPSPCPSTDSSDSAYSAASLTSPRRGFVEPHHNSYNTMFQYDQQCNGTEPEPQPQPQPHTGRQNIHLWQFLKELLSQPQHYGNAIRWVDRSKGIFKIEDSARVARLWGKRKNRPAMNYDKLSRSIRQYYKKGIIKKTEQSKRLVYQFCHPYLL